MMIKSPESMMEKLKRKALPETLESALCEVHDAVGVRVICSFADDIASVDLSMQTIRDIIEAEE